MGRSRDIADMLSKTELANTGNEALVSTFDAVDSAYVSDNSVPALAFYSTLDSLPVTSLTSGQQAYVSANNRLYISDGSGWYNKALIRLAPTMTLDPTGTITLATDGTTTSTVTIIAADSDTPGSGLTYSVESDGSMLGRAVISQDSSVFTIRPLSEDSGATTGTFTLTFKTSDGTNLATDTSDFSLTFATTVDSSSATVLLMKATGSAKAHEGISYQYGSSPTTDIVGFTTSTGTPVASSFSPYREGGYSTYFPEAYNDRIFVDPTTGSDFAFGTGDFTVEAWVYLTEVRSADMGIAKNWNSQSVATTGQWLFEFQGSNADLRVGDYSAGIYTTASTSCVAGVWYHVAVSREGSTVRLFVDGVSLSTTDTGGGVGSVNFLTTSGEVYIGYGLVGYIKDLRVVKGTAVYTANFTAPTEPLTAISGTELLTCHLPYFADGSTNADAVTVIGNSQMAPFGPFDYNPFTLQTDVGSTFLSTGVSGMAETTNHQAISNFGSGDFTIELWYYPTTLANYHTLYTGRANTGTYGQLTWLVATGGNFLSYASSTGSTWNVVAEAGTTIKVIKNAWNHLAYVRNGNTWTIYVNGIGEVVSTNSGTLVANTLLQIGYENTNQFYQGAGYISDYRIVKGSAVYTSNFTPPTEKLTWVTNTTLQLQNTYDTYIYDAAAADRLTLVGDTQSTTAQRKFTTSSSVTLDGTGDYIELGNSGIVPSGTEDFTIEGWIYINAHKNYNFIYSSNYTNQLYLTSSGYIAMAANDGDNSTTYTVNSVDNVALSTATWYHIAYVRNGSSFKTYVNGTEYLSATSSSSIAAGAGATIGAFYNSGSVTYNFNGYIQDFRITKGKARYTANFTPPTTEFEL